MGLLVTLGFPIYLILLTLPFLPPAILVQLVRLDFSIEHLRHRWFSLFWIYHGPQSSAYGEPHVAGILPKAHGVVLDVGTGAGHWLHLYDPSKITRLIAVEPNPGHHGALRIRAQKAGLEGKFEIVGDYVQNLHQGSVKGIGPGTIDTVVTLQVLCSVPNPESVISALYGLLAPGGDWIIYEHVKTKSSTLIVRAWQRILDTVWWTCFDNCELQRDTELYLRHAGKWKSFDLLMLDDDTSVVPKMAGILVKA